MKLFHGTSSQAAQDICNGEWRGSERSEFTDGFRSTPGEGVVFLTDCVDEAEGYGDAVVAVDIPDEDVSHFQQSPISNANEYTVDVNVLNENGMWWQE